MKLPKLPQLLDRKIYKTGQTRGADDDVIYQNRVARNSTVLIPYPYWNNSFKFPNEERKFERGFIILISPNEYFTNSNIDEELKSKELEIGVNTLVFYETREQWDRNNPEKLSWQPAQSRRNPLDGQYVARVPATTAVVSGEKLYEDSPQHQVKALVFGYMNMPVKKRLMNVVPNSNYYFGFAKMQNKPP